MKTITFVTNSSLSYCEPIESAKYVRLSKEVGDKVKSHFYMTCHQDDDAVFVYDEYKDYIEQPRVPAYRKNNNRLLFLWFTHKQNTYKGYRNYRV